MSIKAIIFDLNGIFIFKDPTTDNYVIDQKMFDFAKNLKTKYKLFLLSNNSRSHTDYFYQKFPDLFKIFDHVYFSYETGFVKPEPKSFENILNDNNLIPAECVFFDDHSGHVQSAIDLGLNARVFEDKNSCQNFISTF